MTAAARKESRGFGSAQFTTSTPNEAHNFEGVDFSIVRARANAAKKELLTVCRHRIELGQPINKRSAAYLWTRTLRLFRAGLYRDTRGKNWTRYKRQYFWNWLAPTQANFFAWLDIDAPTDDEREAVESGIRAGRKSRARGFVDPDKAAEMLGVTMAERTALALRTIGATDCNKEQRKELALQRKRENDRTRAAASRAAAGARPRSQSYSAVKPWEAFNMSRRTFYRLDETERAAMLKEAVGERGTDTSHLIYTEPLTRDETVPPENGTNPQPESNIIRLPLRMASAFSRATGIKIGSPGWRAEFDAFIANDDMAGALNAPPPEVAADPDEEPARWDWWRQPVPGWREGRLTIRSILTGADTTIRLEDGAILSHKQPMEEFYED